MDQFWPVEASQDWFSAPGGWGATPGKNLPEGEAKPKKAEQESDHSLMASLEHLDPTGPEAAP